MESLSGYIGTAKNLLKKANANVGDLIYVKGEEGSFQGVLMPRTEFGAEDHIVIKLKSGYNIGVKVTDSSDVNLLESGERKPMFRKARLPEHSLSLPRIDVISTGGTIASRVDYRTGGVEPALNAEDLYSIFPELSQRANIHAKILFSEYSENITIDHYKKMASAVEEAVYEKTQGIVICHGTDTMGYTAAALSFVLEDLPVPVVLVGSQRSSDRPSSDAATNLLSAVSTAKEAPFAEVVIAMHDSTSDDRIAIHRGTKVRKCHTSSRTAFKSINISPIAYYDIIKDKLDVTGAILRKRDNRQLKVKANFDEKVALVKFYPGMNPEFLDWYLDKNFHGLILEGTGLGHVSNKLYRPLERAKDMEVFVGMTSQCIWGMINMNVYFTGRDLLKRGVTPLKDMLPETALIKLMWVLGSYGDLNEIKKVMLTNIAGELGERILLR